MIKLKEDKSGKVEISDEVILAIANASALEIDGILVLENNIANEIAGMFGKKNFLSRI